ncbi:monooxygenase [Streptosporangiaceae bacterium NEAU-GS5]|nr:monooxygenase [Streptosporangiaceae bacterium NEAU-GS5]
MGVALVAIALITSCSVRENATPTSGHAALHSAQAIPAAAPLREGERFVTLKLPAPYTPVAPSGGTDEYRCFVLDPGLTGSAFLTGSQFLPQNTDIVHHAIIYRVDAAEAAKAQQLDAQDAQEGYTCFGDSGVDNDQWVGHWAPGANETLFTQKIGYPMPAGSKLVMQVHYNLLAEKGASDQSSIRLRLTGGSSGFTALNTEQFPAPIELPCTPQESGPLCDRAAAVKDVAKRFGREIGEMADQLAQGCGHPTPGNTQHCDQQVPVSGTVYAVAGHMHLLGRAIKIELNPGTPQAHTLLDIPNYDFDAQSIRPLSSPLEVKAGDTLRVTCTHDASLRSKLPALQGQPARYVVWGDGTSDEMCLGLVIWAPSSA